MRNISKDESIIIFDFDGTMTTETWPKFWVWVKKFGYDGTQRNEQLENALAEYRKTRKGNDLELFFGFFSDLLVKSKEKITHEDLMEGEKYITYNPGIKQYLKNSTSKNYIISGGLKEFLKNLEIAKHFDEIYGTPVVTSSDGSIIGIGEVMTDDKKILAIRDILKRNGKSEIDCSNVIFIGDGYSDPPAMRYIHNNGGEAIFVHQPTQEDDFYEHNNKIYRTLEAEGIIDHCFVADYSEGTELVRILNKNNIPKF